MLWFFWVIPWCLNFMCQCFRTHCLFHLHRLTYEDGTDTVFQNIQNYYSVIEESSKNKNTSFKKFRN
jgi:hypothetical protein